MEFPTVLFSATREMDLQRAQQGIQQIRRIYPQVEIVLFTTLEHYHDVLIDEVRFLPKGINGYLAKIQAIRAINRPLLLYLDCDTYLVDRIDELVELLHHFDIAAAHATIRSTFDVGVPISFPEMNTGVLLLRKGDQMNKMIDAWHAHYCNLLNSGIDPPSRDQPSLRYVLFTNGDIRMATITPEYNCRFNLGSLVFGDVKILHGMHPRLDKIATQVNQITKSEVSQMSRLRYIREDATPWSNLKYRIIRRFTRL